MRKMIHQWLKPTTLWRRHNFKFLIFTSDIGQRKSVWVSLNYYINTTYSNHISWQSFLSLLSKVLRWSNLNFKASSPGPGKNTKETACQPQIIFRGVCSICMIKYSSYLKKKKKQNTMLDSFQCFYTRLEPETAFWKISLFWGKYTTLIMSWA